MTKFTTKKPKLGGVVSGRTLKKQCDRKWDAAFDSALNDAVEREFHSVWQEAINREYNALCDCELVDKICANREYDSLSNREYEEICNRVYTEALNREWDAICKRTYAEVLNK